MEGRVVVEYGRERDREIERMVCSKHGVWVLLCCVEDAVHQVGSQILIGYEPKDSNSQ